MPTPAKRTSNKSLADYATLLRKVKETLVHGHQKIEEQKVRTYWETGDLILRHSAYHRDREENYGKQVAERLASDLDLHVTVLYRCVQFVEQYPNPKILASRRELTWSHFRELLAVPDARSRLLLENEAVKNEWSSEELGVRAKRYRSVAKPVTIKTTAKAPSKPFVPLRGQLYTYQVVRRPTLGTGEGADDLLIDLGFGMFHNVDARVVANFKDGDIVQSRPRQDAYRFAKINATAKDLYTYNAFVERVIDGDTLKVRIDLGFDTWSRHTVRLRGIDCPEMDTPEGRSAKTFVQSYIKEAQQIVVRSSRSDKYDRYLADVFVPSDAGEVYLNNLLLEQGHATRMSD